MGTSLRRVRWVAALFACMAASGCTGSPGATAVIETAALVAVIPLIVLCGRDGTVTHHDSTPTPSSPRSSPTPFDH